MTWRRDKDPVIRDILGDYTRAAISLVMGILLLVVWGVLMTWAFVGAGTGSPMQLTRLVASFCGWGGAGLVAISLVQYGYAYIHLRLIARSDTEH